MAHSSIDHLAADALARNLGTGGLHPRLRIAQLADAAGGARRAGPPPLADLAGPLPANVVRFPALAALRDGAS